MKVSRNMPQMARDGKNKYGEPRPRKVCDKCRELLPQHKFSYIVKTDPSKGTRDTCKSCSKIRAEYEKQRRAENWKSKPAQSMLNNSKQRAKLAGLEHTLTLDDIIIPDYCPVLGIKLEVGDRKNHQNAPSIDRIDNTKGYTKDNIVVVSIRANLLKKDATVQELIALAEFYSKLDIGISI